MTIFLIINQAKNRRFFGKTFLIVKVNLDKVLKILFFILSNADIYFLKKRFDENFILLIRLFTIKTN